VLLAKHNIDIILIAIPSATGAEMTRILNLCHAGVECQTVPSLGEIIESNGLATQIREVAVEDLLGRNPVRLEEDQIRGRLKARSSWSPAPPAPSAPNSAARSHASTPPAS
jgi:FlaA1/EpsC-like NDP-sugar epimerase